jgi:kinesin family protein 3/17
LQTDVYLETAKPIVNSCIDGYNGTVFCYGQTGAGKTFTMEGKDEPKHLRGLIYNTFYHIFEHIETMSSEMEFLVRVSFLEIYNEELRDLIGKDRSAKLEIKESKDTGVYVKGLTSYVVKDGSQIDNVLQTGKKNRTVGATLMNAESSRSHSIFMITIETSEKSVVDGENHIKMGKMSLVDLAGSERANKTGATGDRLKEGCKINLSLSALGNVISALVEGKGGHVPYRDSKLTRLLQDSLGGNTKTVMVANISPADFNYEETLSTLRYASRAKKIQNKPKVNEDPKDAMLKAFQEEIKKLKEQLELASSGVPMQVAQAIPNTQTPTSPVNPESAQVNPNQALSPTIIQQVVSTVNEEKLNEIMKQKEEEKQKMLEEMTAKSAESEEKLNAIVLQQEEEKRALLESMKQKTEEEKKIIEQEFANKQRALEEERAKMEENLQKNNEALQRHTELIEQERKRQEQLEKEKEDLAKKLEEMQAHVVRGKTVEKLEEANKRQQEKMKKQKEELARRKEEEEKIKKQLQDKNDERIELEQQYASIQDEVEVKTKKLQKLFAKFKAAKSEVHDLQAEFQQERMDYLYTIRQLERDLRLKTKIIDNFVPQEEVNKITSRATWDEEKDEWLIAHISVSGNNVKSRPQSSRNMNGFDGNRSLGSQSSLGRSKQDNVVSLELEMPERTTQDFDGAYDDGASPPPSNLAYAYVLILDLAKCHSENGNSVYYSYGGSKSKKSSRPTSGAPTKRPKTASKKNSSKVATVENTDAQYPSSRGLVKSRHA